ncbi:MAG: ATP-binding protein [Jatrophihabitans sp.]|uniref:ATP-binding protein n=1 Tax=Jatrophihabitans sp. TaxID=1932789 RepID=UPI0039156EB9
MTQLRAVVELPASVRSAATARALVRALLPAWGLTPVVDDAELVVSELVSNAVEHAPGSETYELEVSQRDGNVRISLIDGSSIRPVVAELAHDRPRGRGMRMVEALTDSWGADDHHGGKRVWVELHASGGHDDP